MERLKMLHANYRQPTLRILFFTNQKMKNFVFSQISRLFALCCAFFFWAVAVAAPPPGYYLVWSDEFNGSSLDTTKWGYRLPGVFRDGYDTPGALSFNGSNLVI